jgi:hypothetical protein
MLLLKPIATNGGAGHDYLLSNANPGYFGNGTFDTTSTFSLAKVTTTTCRRPERRDRCRLQYLRLFPVSDVYHANETIRGQVMKDTADFCTYLQEGILNGQALGISLFQH